MKISEADTPESIALFLEELAQNIRNNAVRIENISFSVDNFIFTLDGITKQAIHAPSRCLTINYLDFTK